MRQNISRAILIAALCVYGVACDGEDPDSSGQGVTVNSVRSKAAASWRQFIGQPGIGTIVYNGTATNALGVRSANKTRIATFYHKGDRYRVDMVGGDGSPVSQMVLSGQQVRQNLHALGITNDLFIDKLKPANQTKVWNSTKKDTLLESIPNNKFTLTQDSSRYYLSAGPIREPILGDTWITWVIDKGSHDIVEYELHAETLTGGVVDETYTFTKQKFSDLPDSLFTIPGTLATYNDWSGKVDTFLDQAQ